jgi:cytoskeleton protein RodZ
MSEVTDQMADASRAETEPTRKPSAGEMLRQAREDAGMHLPALAVALKVSVKKLEALEADRLDLLPDAVFVRALASSVCRALKIDPAPILSQLPQTAVPRLEMDGCGLNTPFQTPGDVSRVSFWNQLSRPVVLAALALLVGALVLIFFPAMDSLIVPVAAVSESGAAASPDSPDSSSNPTQVTGGAAPVALPPLNHKTAAPASPGPPVAVAKAATPPTAAVQPASSASKPVTTPIQGRATHSGVIVFKTQGPSWVEVTDAEGGVQIRRTINAGEVVGVSGALPLTVVVGRADITEVEVRGKPFALTAFTRENVARFEVKQ